MDGRTRSRSTEGYGWLAAGAWVAVLCVQCAWYASRHAQPVWYDALQYQRLSLSLQDWFELPLLVPGGFRTYAYPLLVRTAGSYLYLFQIIAFVLLMAVLRYTMLPRSPYVDLWLIGICLAAPIMAPYTAAVLADLPGAVLLQAGLLCLSLQWSITSRVRLSLLSLLAGLMFGWAVQMRPGFQHLCWPLVGVIILRFADRRVGDWKRRLLFGLTCCVLFLSTVVLSSLPTLYHNRTASNKWAIVPDMSSLMNYHLTLGLWMDKWSSYDPPIARFQQVGREWEKRGWRLLRLDDAAPPTFRDFRREVRRHPWNALARWSKHVYFGFNKWEVFPYAGRLSWQRRLMIWATNWFLLIMFALQAWHMLRRESSESRRAFAGLQLLLAAYLAVTIAAIVPEERHSLAVYPGAIILCAAWCYRMSISARNSRRQSGDGVVQA